MNHKIYSGGAYTQEKERGRERESLVAGAVRRVSSTYRGSHMKVGSGFSETVASSLHSTPSLAELRVGGQLTRTITRSLSRGEKMVQTRDFTSSDLLKCTVLSVPLIFTLRQRIRSSGREPLKMMLNTPMISSSSSSYTASLVPNSACC